MVAETQIVVMLQAVYCLLRCNCYLYHKKRLASDESAVYMLFPGLRSNAILLCDHLLILHPSGIGSVSFHIRGILIVFAGLLEPRERFIYRTAKYVEAPNASCKVHKLWADRP